MAAIDRSGADALIPVEYTREIAKGAVEMSHVMRLGKRAPDMTSKSNKIPVLSALPVAYFVNGDTGQKQTTSVSWAGVTLTAEEIACIVPIPEAVLDDADYDIWGETTPLIQEAIGVAVDRAVIHGTNKPASWPAALVAGATSAGNVVIQGAGVGYDTLLGEAGLISKIEADGFIPTAHLAAIAMRGKLRSIKDTTNAPIFRSGMQSGTPYDLDGAPIYFPQNGAIDPAAALMVSGDWSKLVYAIRQDITYKVLTEATIYDVDGTTILYRLAQQDMVALRVVFRMAVALPNPINRVQAVEANRYPFAVLTPAAS
jgi:HK97 family phage major capsid protein